VATEAAGTPAARFLSLPFSSAGQFVQQLNKGELRIWWPWRCRAFMWPWKTRQCDRWRRARRQGGVKGLATERARVAHAGFRAESHKFTSPAV
jgi:hypothetical protein